MVALCLVAAREDSIEMLEMGTDDLFGGEDACFEMNAAIVVESQAH